MMSPTIHNEANKNDIADFVLMPGDPVRAEFIAEEFFSNKKSVNSIRGMHGFSGTYKNRKVTVQGSGIGMPSMALYSHELFSYYGVNNIIRTGSTGGLVETLELNSIVIPIGACTDSNYQRHFKLPGVFAPTASFSLLKKADVAAKKLGIKITIGLILTSDVFYFDNEQDLYDWTKMGVIAVDMETAALYTNAARFGKNALSLLTVSDNLVTGEKIPPKDRERTFGNMIDLALEIAHQTQ